MPTYDFACTQCEEHFEKQLPFQDNQSEVTCLQGHRAVQRIYTPPFVVFKGNGWYSTDQHRKNRSTASTSE